MLTDPGWFVVRRLVEVETQITMIAHGQTDKSSPKSEHQNIGCLMQKRQQMVVTNDAERARNHVTRQKPTEEAQGRQHPERSLA